MSDPSALLAAADRLADRFRSMPQSRLTELAPGGLALARQLARRAEQLEGGVRRPELPEAGIFVVGDQIALAAHDLAAALTEGARAEGPGGPGEAVGADEPDEEPGRLLAESLAELEAAYRLATTRSARM
ncbi:hypothetical protein ACEZDB_18670 [Streptacidiphilus sp. N1-3]|uniref:Uncharacterized protein n=1 Tax=Streptacidiphilus alkalitolerans TaxID=3342712 RepID=A0ABV6X314_9ACTN